MRKIEGLKFLQRMFPTECVDCVFVTGNTPLNLEDLESHVPQLFRVRAARETGSELNAPYQTCHSASAVADFIKGVRKLDRDWNFVIHRVDEAYFKPRFVGSIALFCTSTPCIVIELQSLPEKASAGLIAGVYSGSRPRDWETAARFLYPFYQRVPEVSIFDPEFRPQMVCNSLYRLWRIGRKIDQIKVDVYSNDAKPLPESVARFNLYVDGSILLDDYRHVESFH